MGTYNISWALLAGRECILLVHWFDCYDWYEWNIHSIGIPLVKCISLWDVIIFLWMCQAARESTTSHRPKPGESWVCQRSLTSFPLVRDPRSLLALSLQIDRGEDYFSQ